MIYERNRGKKKNPSPLFAVPEHNFGHVVHIAEAGHHRVVLVLGAVLAVHQAELVVLDELRQELFGESHERVLVATDQLAHCLGHKQSGAQEVEQDVGHVGPEVLREFG